MSDEIERLIATMDAAMRGKPDYPRNLAGLAELVAAKNDPLRAFELARKALGLAQDDPRTTARLHALMSSLIPRYHIAMMNDVRRNTAWDTALRHAIRPGMHVLELGTGAGMLALMAARAGATVTTCEKNPVTAELARHIIARNGYADRITVITKRSLDLELGTDLPRRADLLFCDNFADNLFAFEPLVSLSDARKRLLIPGAPMLPAAASLHAALADWSEYEREVRIGATSGFDLTPMRDFAPFSRNLKVGDDRLRVLGQPREVFRFDLSAAVHPAQGAKQIAFDIAAADEANGVVCWIKLDLGGETVLETRPQPGLASFSNVVFYPFPDPLTVRRGDRVRIAYAYQGKSLETWLASIERGAGA